MRICPASFAVNRRSFAVNGASKVLHEKYQLLHIFNNLFQSFLSLRLANTTDSSTPCTSQLLRCDNYCSASNEKAFKSIARFHFKSLTTPCILFTVFFSSFSIHISLLQISNTHTHRVCASSTYKSPQTHTNRAEHKLRICYVFCKCKYELK